MKAGQCINFESKPVSPRKCLSKFVGELGDGEKEVEDFEKLAKEGERVSFDEETEFVRKLADPSLPNQEVVDKHYVMGHVPYRDCALCVLDRLVET